MKKQAASRGARRKSAGNPARAGSAQDLPSGFWTMLSGILLLASASALGVVYTTHKNRALLNELQQLEQARNRLQVEWGQLLLEQSSLVSQGRLEEVAMTELGMRTPALESVVIVTESRD